MTGMHTNITTPHPSTTLEAFMQLQEYVSEATLYTGTSACFSCDLVTVFTDELRWLFELYTSNSQRRKFTPRFFH